LKKKNTGKTANLRKFEYKSNINRFLVAKKNEEIKKILNGSIKKKKYFLIGVSKLNKNVRIRSKP
jgi:hypothetical protein